MQPKYTPNTFQGLWGPPWDPDGNILLKHPSPPDMSKLEELIGSMQHNDVGAWLVQETFGKKVTISTRTLVATTSSVTMCLAAPMAEETHSEE